MLLFNFFKVEKFRTSPSSQEASLNGSVHIDCRADNGSEVTWFKLNGTLSDNVERLHNGMVHTLRVRMVNEGNYGTYVCQHWKSDEPYTYYYSKAEIRKTGKVIK